jgi:hypothetical protein
MFWKNVVLYEIYSKTLQWPNTFCTSLEVDDTLEDQKSTSRGFDSKCIYLKLSTDSTELEQWFCLILVDHVGDYIQLGNTA